MADACGVSTAELREFAKLAGAALGDFDEPAEPTSRTARRAALRKQLRLRVLRRRETLSLYEPLPGAVVELLRACCGCDPHDKYPTRDGTALAVGLSLDHICDPMFAKMWRPGAVKVIKDERTGLARAVRPDPNNPRQLDPYDEAYREKWTDAPPLLSMRMVRSIAWDNRAQAIPRKITFVTGWQLTWYSSKGDAPQGFFCHLAWIDEQIENEQFYTEINRGLLREPGACAMWSATPQTTNEQLLDLQEKAEAGSENITATKLLLEDNPHISQEAKRVFFETLTPEEREVRYYGNPATAGRRVYRNFDPMEAHGCEAFPVPKDWTRFLALDPGRQYCGTLFAAVDPDEKHVWIYDGFIQTQSDANRWADEIQRRQDDVRFEAFIIDLRMGRQKTVGQDHSVAQYYMEALEAREIRPRLRGPLAGFVPGSDNVLSREEALIDWMRIRPDGPFQGTARLQIVRGLFPQLEKQIRRARYELDKPDKRALLQEDHLVCLEYLAGNGLYYRSPQMRDAEQTSYVLKRLREKRARHRPRDRAIVLG